MSEDWNAAPPWPRCSKAAATICWSCPGSARPPGIWPPPATIRRNFYLWGAMGGAAMIGLGLALAQPDKRVAVITGDGEMLMGMGALATIGIQRPGNLADHRVRQRRLWRDRHAAEPHPERRRSRRRRRAPAASRPASTCATRPGCAILAGRLKTLRETLFARVLIVASEPPRVLPERDGVVLKDRFRAALGIRA